MDITELNHNYLRVIPRDLFNEANLLKCIGKLVIHADMLPRGSLTIETDNAAFSIAQDQSDGSIQCTNIRFFCYGKPIHFFVPLNAREELPLWCNFNDEQEDVRVFSGDDYIFTTKFYHKFEAR